MHAVGGTDGKERHTQQEQQIHNLIHTPAEHPAKERHNRKHSGQLMHQKADCHHTQTHEQCLHHLPVEPFVLFHQHDKEHQAAQYQRLLTHGKQQSYNAAAPEGERLETGDYAAEWRTPVLAETPGGIRTDERGAVLREDGSVLPGLYAVGAAAAGVEDDGTELWSAAERAMLLPGRAVRTALGLPDEPEEPEASD